MANILVIGDIQGSVVWKKIIEKHRGEFDIVVFLGNYFGNPIISPESQVRNFYNILELQKEPTFLTHLLLGKKDFHYLQNSHETNEYYNSEIHHLLQDKLNKEIAYGNLKVAVGYVNMFFTNAGVTNTFYYDLIHRKLGREAHVGLNMEMVLNAALRTKPYVFNLRANQLSSSEVFSSIGNNKFHSPLFVHPDALIKDVYAGYTQIVADSVAPRPKFIKYEHTEILFMSSSFNLNYLMIQNASNPTIRNFKILSL